MVLAAAIPTAAVVVTDDDSSEPAAVHGLSSPTVVEAQAPITSLRLRMGPYPGVTGDKALKCDGTADEQARVNIVSFDKMRIEPVVRFTARPSEHWNVNFEIEAPKRNRPNESSLDWDIQPLTHQNAPPVGQQALSMEVGQFNQYRLLERPGRWRVAVSLVGLVSKQTYRAVCEFTVKAASG